MHGPSIEKVCCSCRLLFRLDTIEDGRIKLFVIWKTLEFRKQCSELFQLGGYRPLAIRGPQSRFLCAFAREYEGQIAIVAVPRLNFTLLGDAYDPTGPEVWGNTSIEFDHKVAEYRNIFTGEVIESQDGGGNFGFVVIVTLSNCAAHQLLRIFKLSTHSFLLLLPSAIHL